MTVAEDVVRILTIPIPSHVCRVTITVCAGLATHRYRLHRDSCSAPLQTPSLPHVPTDWVAVILRVGSDLRRYTEVADHYIAYSCHNRYRGRSVEARVFTMTAPSQRVQVSHGVVSQNAGIRLHHRTYHGDSVPSHSLSGSSNELMKDRVLHQSGCSVRRVRHRRRHSRRSRRRNPFALVVPTTGLPFVLRAALLSALHQVPTSQSASPSNLPDTCSS